MRPQIGLAYLLARTTDTIADTEILPVAQRLEALQKLRERILGQSSAPLNFGELAQQQGSPAEQLLLEKVEAGLALLQKLSPADLKLVREVLTTITSGQELDLRRFGQRLRRETSSRWKRRRSWTITPIAWPAAWASSGRRFAGRICFRTRGWMRNNSSRTASVSAKGLQLVNILRDLPADLKNGRCYLPAQRLDEAKLLPEVLLSPANEPKFLPLFHEYLDKAESHLAAGWRYTNTLPFGQFRVRLACAWPILIGVRTIEKLRAASVIELQQRVKVSRGEVRGILFRSLLACPFPPVVAEIVFARRKSSCFRRRFGVRNRHADFQISPSGFARSRCAAA